MLALCSYLLNLRDFCDNNVSEHIECFKKEKNVQADAKKLEEVKLLLL